MRRRDFITLIGGAAAASAMPQVARAQQGERRVGVLLAGVEGDPAQTARLSAFRRGLEELGWSEGRNVRIEVRWSGGDTGRMRAYAAELVAMAPDVLFGSATPSTSALQQATRTIPIVFAAVIDPIAGGFVTSLSHPGGNITGFSNYEYTIGGKWLELLKEIAPRTTRVLAIANSDNPTWVGHYRSIEAVAPSLGVQLSRVDPRSVDDLERALAPFAGLPGAGVVSLPSPFVTVHSESIVALAAKYRVPTMYADHLHVPNGGLIYYGVDNVELHRLAASYVDRILKGAKPADLPVQVATKYELVINLRTAKALGLDVPWFLQQRADEVIE